MLVFIDTNVIEQCEPLAQLDWSQAGIKVPRGGVIDVCVALATLDELDKHKSQGNARRAQRARAFLSSLDDLLDGDAEFTEVRGRDCTLRIRVGRPVEAWPEELGLDRDEADDRLIAEVEACASKLAPSSVHLITGDRGLRARIKARSVSFERHKLPDAWLLAPEPDEAARRNALLERRISALESVRPVIAVRVLRADGKALSPEDGIPLRGRVCRDATSDEIERFIDIACAHWSHAHVTFAPGVSGWTQPDDRFRQVSWQACHALGASFSLSENATTCFQLEVSNTGGAPASALRIRVAGAGGYRPVSCDLATRKPHTVFPFPPIHGRGAWKNTNGTEVAPILSRASPRELVRDEHGPWGENWAEFVVPNFRHHYSTTIPFAISPDPNTRPGRGALIISWMMDNHPDRQECTYPIRGRFDAVTLADAAREMDLEEPYDTLVPKAFAGA